MSQPKSSQPQTASQKAKKEAEKKPVAPVKVADEVLEDAEDNKKKPTTTTTTTTTVEEKKKAEEKPKKEKKEGDKKEEKGKGEDKEEEKPKRKRQSKDKAEKEEEKEKEQEEEADEAELDKIALEKGMKIVLLTNLEGKQRVELRGIAKKLGLHVTQDESIATYVVCGVPPTRTLSLMRGILRGAWVLSKEWLVQSNKQGKLLPEADFEVSKEFPGCRISREKKTSEGKSHQGGLFHDLSFVVGPNKAPQSHDIKRLIEIGGGIVCSQKDLANATFFIQSSAEKKDKNVPVGVTLMKDKALFDCIANYKVPEKNPKKEEEKKEEEKKEEEKKKPEDEKKEEKKEEEKKKPEEKMKEEKKKPEDEKKEEKKKTEEKKDEKMEEEEVTPAKEKKKEEKKPAKEKKEKKDEKPKKKKSKKDDDDDDDDE